MPVYAEAWSPQQASSVTSAVNSIAGYIANFSSHFTDWVGVGANTSGMTSTWNQFYTRWLVFQTDFNNMVSWLVPSGSNSNNTATMLDSVIVLTNYAMNHLPDISTIAGYVSSWMNSNNTYLSQLVGSAPLNSGNGLLKALTNYLYIRNNYSNSMADIYQSAHRGLSFGYDSDTDLYNLLYGVNIVRPDGTITSNATNWNWGTPIGNIAWILQQGLYSLSNLGNGILLNAKDNLTTWEHSTNTQTPFTPTSFANGLYRYLAYIQSDTSSIWYTAFKNINDPWNLHRYDQNLVPSKRSAFDTLYWYLANIWDNSHRRTSSQYLGQIGLYRKDLVQASNYYLSTDDLLVRFAENTSLFLSRLAYVLANDEEIAARNAAKDDQNTVINNFVASSGNASASPTDFATVSAASSDFQNNFDTGVSASGVWTAFSNNYEWFTQTTADNLDTSQNNTRSVNYETPYLDNYYSEVMGFFENKRSDIKESPDYVSTFIEKFNAEREAPIEEEQK